MKTYLILSKDNHGSPGEIIRIVDCQIAPGGKRSMTQYLTWDDEALKAALHKADRAKVEDKR